MLAAQIEQGRRRLRRSRSNSWPGTRATPSASAWRAFRASALFAATVVETERLPQWTRVRGLARSGPTAEFHRRQTSPGRDIQALKPCRIGRAQLLNFRNPYFISGDAGPTGIGRRGVSPVDAGGSLVGNHAPSVMVDGEDSEIKPTGWKCRNTLLMEQL